MALKLIQGDCLEKLKGLEAESVHSLVTDPPAGISFMGKDWDGDKGGRKEWITWMSAIMAECARVMKPGAHGLVWALPRTSHWTATALEDAGFEIRDAVTHLFGQGFPKSLDISKAIDKAAGAEREVVGTYSRPDGSAPRNAPSGFSVAGENQMPVSDSRPITVPATEAAKQWQGWGTALKPASEHWILVRKPCSEKTVAANTLKHGTGGINIDGSRIEALDQAQLEKNWDRSAKAGFGNGLLEGGIQTEGFESYKKQGRFPANLVLSHTPECEPSPYVYPDGSTESQCSLWCPVRMLDEQSGNLGKSSGGNAFAKNRNDSGTMGTFKERQSGVPCGFGDSGGASRFFYCAKISAGERNAGLENEPDREGGIKNTSGRGFSESDPNRPVMVKNHHPTVKPQKLMRYLIKLITPPGGTVLDPFMGSGSTGLAAAFEGFDFIGIERQPDYFEISEKRIFNNFPEVVKQTFPDATAAGANVNTETVKE